jgi:hypothetical protein
MNVQYIVLLRHMTKMYVGALRASSTYDINVESHQALGPFSASCTYDINVEAHSALTPFSSYLYV